MIARGWHLALAAALGAALAGPGALADPPAGAGDCGAGADWAARARDRSLNPPPGLPPMTYPPDNPPEVARIELGRKLFFDRRLSINGTQSCAVCHVPEQAFANRELQTAVGVEGRSGKRNAPGLINVGYLRPLFHDGRDEMLETQFLGPLLARNEMANPSAGRVVAMIADLPDYAGLFPGAFDGAGPSVDRIGMALASYQRTLTLGPSAFDRWRYGGEPGAMGAAEQRGHALFAGRAGCADCHLEDETFALFTDQQFHDTGYGWRREQERQQPAASRRVEVAPGVFHQIDAARIGSVARPREPDLGRYEVTEDPADRWRFRTPSLRNVAETAPYMHDGGLSSLRDVLDFYNRGGGGSPEQDPRIRPLDLTEAELADLEAFLRALSAPGLDCLVAEGRSSAADNP